MGATYDMEIVEALRGRLAGWGYPAEAEEAVCLAALARAAAYIEQFCGAAPQTLDGGLGEVWLDLAGAYFLQARAAFGAKELIGLSGAGGELSSIRLGDVAVSFGGGAQSRDSALGISGFIERVIGECRERLIGFRRLEF